MYLSEEQRKVIITCINNRWQNSDQPKEKEINYPHDTKEGKKIPQLLFEDRDGKEVFTPF
jgi:hypothetical protein